MHQCTNVRLSVTFRDPVVTSNRLRFSMLSKHYCVGAAAATCLALVILVATIHSTTAQHLTVVPNTSTSLRPANMSTSLEILGEYHRQKDLLLRNEVARSTQTSDVTTTHYTQWHNTSI